MLLTKCYVCGSKKSRFMKEQEATELLSSLGLKSIPLNSCYQYKMNEIVNKFLLAGGKFLPEMYL